MPRERQTTCKVCGQPRANNGKSVALCAEHLREYQRNKSARSRKVAPVADPEYRRIHAYHAAALRLGATDDQAWWCATAANAQYTEIGARIFRPAAFIAAELAWLRDNADVFAKLDAAQWQPVPGESGAVEDEGYQEWDVA